MKRDIFATRASQKDMVLNYLLSGRGITHLKAQSEFKCMRLADVIYKLRAEGYHIESQDRRSFTGRRYAEYVLR